MNWDAISLWALVVFVALVGVGVSFFTHQMAYRNGRISAARDIAERQRQAREIWSKRHQPSQPEGGEK